jgi:hypothetical protein
LYRLNSDGRIILEVRETTYGCENSIGRLLALRSVTKVPLTPYLEQFTDLAKASKEY